MNFYGHAVFAARLSRTPRYVLGSMLPDFEGMCGARLLGVTDEDVREGIALHHATDSVFHGAPEFLELCSYGLVELTRHGVARATARAVAHVGTELVFDSFLIETYGSEAAYLEALDSAHPSKLGSVLTFVDGGDRFELLRNRLADFGVPSAYSDPGFVADRLVNALASRPRLAMRDGERDIVATFLEMARPRILDAAPHIVARVADALERR